jgi:hypothetical protein
MYNTHKRSYRVWLRIKRSLNLSTCRSYFGHFDCILCLSRKQTMKNIMTATTNEQQQQQLQQLYRITEHQRTRSHQREFYKQLKKHMTETQLIVCQDFGTLSIMPHVGSQHVKYLTDLVLMLEWKKKEEEMDPKKPHDTHHRLYIDILGDGEDNKNDYHYVRAAWEYIITQTHHFDSFNDIHIFSDGASKHFKQVFAMSYWASIQPRYGIRLTYDFFASYHGHGAWDAHIAHAQRAIVRHLNIIENQRYHGQSTTFSPLTCADDVAKILNLQLDHTRAYVLHEIDRSPHLKPNLSSLPDGIMIYHHFIFPTAYEVKTADRACDMTSDAYVTQRFQLVGTKKKSKYCYVYCFNKATSDSISMHVVRNKRPIRGLY